MAAREAPKPDCAGVNVLQQGVLKFLDAIDGHVIKVTLRPGVDHDDFLLDRHRAGTAAA